MCSLTEASLFLTREFPESIQEEDVMYSFSTYIAENAESLNLVEGEKVFVLGMLSICSIMFTTLIYFVIKFGFFPF